MKTQITKKELAKKLYQVVASCEKVSFSTVYQRSFFTKENVLRYIGKAHVFQRSSSITVIQDLQYVNN